MRRHERSFVGRYLRAFLVARSRIAEDLLGAAVERGVSQYVLLGAGFDTFAYRNPHLDLQVYELDHPATQSVKRRRLEYAQIAIPANVSYIRADLGEVTLAQALASSRFDASRPAVFAWLGVVPYLELPAIQAVLSYIGSLPARTELVFDYGVPPASLNFVARFFYRRIAKRVEEAGEPWKTFFTPRGIDGLLRECGFEIVQDLGADEINARYFANRSDRLRVADVGHIVTAAVTAPAEAGA